MQVFLMAYFQLKIKMGGDKAHLVLDHSKLEMLLTLLTQTLL